MASPVPAKSQPLHYFSLPRLKWKKNHTNNHQRGRSRLADSSSPHQSPSRQSPPSACRRSPMSDSPAAGPRQSPMRDSAVNSPQQQQPQPRRRLQSPMRGDSAVRHSPMRDSSRHSPIRDSSAPRLSSPMGDSTSDSDCSGGYVIYENRKNSYTDGVRTGLLGTNPDRLIEKLAKNLSVTDGGDLSMSKESRSKIYIRLRKNNNNNKHDDAQEEEKEEKADELTEDGKAEAMDVEAEESVPKTWNLRPRKPIRKLPGVNGGSSKVENKAHQLQRAAQIRPESDGSTAEKKEKKQKFSIPLLREEIEEDIFALTGSKAPRRPKKRAKSVQKQLDNLFPGMWLGMISPDSYKVTENPSKG